MPRTRSVRLAYPQEFKELCRILIAASAPRDVASALLLPLSTVYRWMASSKNESPQSVYNSLDVRPDELTAQRLKLLVAECESKGFFIRRAVSGLVPIDFYDDHDGLLNDRTREKKYSFLSGLPGQIVIGELHFRSDSSVSVIGAVEIESTDIRRISGIRSRMLLAKMEIDQHYYTRLSCKRLAQLVCMSKFNMIRSFQKAFGVSPYQYLNKVRVDHALHMLALTDQPIRKVALGVGFASASSLNRAFKRFTGRSPAQLANRISPAA